MAFWREREDINKLLTKYEIPGSMEICPCRTKLLPMKLLPDFVIYPLVPFLVKKMSLKLGFGVDSS